MCGIAGIYYFQDNEAEIGLLERLKAKILHRGPDGSGIYTNKNVGLVHTRLSIQDLSDAAHQPMFDEISQTCISYNGEIYNFKVLRKELESLGVTFNSTGDTEVLLKACIQYGVEETLPKLNGMFAFAFWDDKKKELWLARDRMGIKPLYYFNEGNKAVFASEIKALLPLQQKVKPDIPVLFEILNGGTGCEPYTLFSGINALNPGSYIHLKQDTSEIIQKEYHSIFDQIDESLYRDYYNSSLESMSEKFFQTLDDSVKIHSISDAPVATLISGGVDSSIISALTSKYCEGISLYHADVVGENSEMIYAQQVAEHLGLNFVSAQLTADSYINNLVDTTYYHETPSAYHPNDVPFQLISRRANEDGIKVFLTGEGADELFVGYGDASKEILRNKIKHTTSRIPIVRSLFAIVSKIYPYHEGGSMTESLAGRGTSHEWVNRAHEAYDFVDCEIEKKSLVSSAYYQKVHLNSLLQRNDRMGMMHALESRIPFLENEMHKFAMNLPIKFKHPVSWRSILRGNPLTRNKIVVREAARNFLPKTITKRKKLGFPITPETYMDLNPNFFIDGFVEQTLNLKQKNLCDIFSGASSDDKWNLFSTELFGRMYFMDEDRSGLINKITDYSRF